ncbi:MATE family efflux transporter [Spirochaetia bacterium 38H-sp]|uniref:MATE family efflux transporter n=1 Tax=Rarispira pelagica TaxID=3141764 RepID=A0ABU9UAE3_9SPIR
MRDNKISLRSLTLPILVETLLRTTLSSVDTFMLGRFADQAAGAVGAIQQFMFFTLVVYTVGATGTSIIVSQYLGAGRKHTAAEVSLVAILFNLGIGVFLSIVMRLAMPYILDSLKLEYIVRTYAEQYVRVYFTFSFFQAVSVVLSAILRSHGYSKLPMYVNMGANLLNIIGNYIFLFGPGGLPVLGVTGVAISTVSSQFLGVAAMLVMIFKHKDISLFKDKAIKLRFTYAKDIVKIGAPSAGETLSYNLAQVAILYMIAPMGTIALTSYTYSVILSRFAYIIALSLGGASQILVGHKVGKGDNDDAFMEVIKATAIGMMSGFFVMSLMAVFRYKVVGLLTSNQDIIELTAKILLISVIYETGRPMNLIVISGLKGAGDVLFPVMAGIIMMWGISVTGAWFFGVHIAMGLVGIWIGRMLDEWLRGIVMLIRWFSRAWHGKSVVREEISA